MSEENQQNQNLDGQTQNTYENFDTNLDQRTKNGFNQTYETNQVQEQVNDSYGQEHANEYQSGIDDNQNMNGYQTQANNAYMNNGYQSGGDTSYTNNGYQSGQSNNPYMNNGYQAGNNPYMNQGQPNVNVRRVEPNQESGGFGIAAFIIGIATIILCCTCINIPVAVVGIILGIVQLTKGGKKVFAILGIVFCSIAIILGIVFWTLVYSSDSFKDALNDIDGDLSYYENTVQMPDYGIENSTYYYG